MKPLTLLVLFLAVIGACSSHTPETRLHDSLVFTTKDTTALSKKQPTSAARRSQHLQQERKSLVYVNMVGWVDYEKAEFIFVVFSNGGGHQYDCFIDYKYDVAAKAFVQENVRFESPLSSQMNQISVPAFQRGF